MINENNKEMEFKDLYKKYEEKLESYGIEIESYDLFAKEIEISVWDCLETSKKILEFYKDYEEPHNSPIWCCANNFREDWDAFIIRYKTQKLEDSEVDRQGDLVDQKFIEDLQTEILKELIKYFNLFVG